MENSSLGLIIHKTLQQFYPNNIIPVSSEQIQNILNKAQITKKIVIKKKYIKLLKY